MAKAKLRHLSINAVAVQTTDEEEVNFQPSTLLIGLKDGINTYTALLDSGADVNILSIDIFNKLRNKQKESTTVQLSTFNHNTSECSRKVNIPLHIQGKVEETPFYLVRQRRTKTQ